MSSQYCSKHGLARISHSPPAAIAYLMPCPGLALIADFDVFQYAFTRLTATSPRSVRISTAGENLLKLQEMLQGNFQELVGMIDVAGQEQSTFQREIQKDVLALDDSVGTVKQKQSRLQDQIEEVKDSTEIMSSDLQAAIEQLEDGLSRRGTPEQPEIIEIEPPGPSSLSSEPNSVE